MELTQDWQDSERPLIHYHSRSFSRKHLLQVLETEVDRDHTDYQLKQLLGNINLKEDQQGRDLPCDTQIQAQDWDLNAVDRVIDELRRQLHTGDADGLIIIQATDEAIVSLNEDDTAKRNIVPEISSPKTAYDPDRELFRNAHPQDMEDVVAIATRHAVNFGPAIAVRLAPSNPTIPAPSPFTPGEPGGTPFYMPNPALLSTNIDGIQETYYNQDLRYDRLGASDSGGAGARRSSDGGEGGGCTGVG